MVLTGRKWSWSVAAGEFLVIALGVLGALTADAWNDARRDRIAEGEYLERLHAELQVDTARHTFILGWMDRKEESLRRIAPVLGSRAVAVEDTAKFVSDLANASNFGWNVGPLATDATFEDLRSSGKLGLIQDAALRSRIIEYYRRAEAADRRIEARGTDYPHIAYRVIPTSSDQEANRFGGSERAVVEDMGALLASVRASGLSEHVLAETNRAIFIRNSITTLRGLAIQLLNVVSANLDSRE